MVRPSHARLRKARSSRRPAAAGLALALVVAPALAGESMTPRLLPALSGIAAGISPQGYLGVTVQNVDGAHAGKERLHSTLGAQVVSLDHDAPAAKAGMHSGDIIEALDGQPIPDAATLSRLLRDMPAGRRIDLQVVHNARIEHLHLQLADRQALVQHAWAHHFHVPIPEPAPMVNTFAGQLSFAGDAQPAAGEAAPEAYIGAQVEPLTSQLAKFFGVSADSGLLVRAVEQKSPAAAAGLDAGDVILSANGMPLETASDWVETLRINAGHPVPITVLRNRKTITLTITVDGRITQSELRIPAEFGRLIERLLHPGL